MSTLDFLHSLGYATGDRVYVRAIAPKKTPMPELLARGMAWTPPDAKRPVPIAPSGYIELRGNGASFTRIYSDGKTKKHPWGLKHLRRLNAKGYGVYFVVNPGGGDDEAITESRALFYECDAIGKADQWEQLRQLQAATGGNWTAVETFKSLHCYGHLSQPLTDLGEWRQLQQRLIQRQDSDPSIHNPARLMRLPGFDHWRWDGEALQSSPVTLRQIGQPGPLVAIEAVLPEWDQARWEKKASGVTHSHKGSISSPALPTAVDSPWDIRNFAHHLEGFANGRRGWDTAKCPAHNGESDNSLHINTATGAFTCHGGCNPKSVYSAALDLACSRGYERPKGKGGGGYSIPQSQRLVATHTADERWVADALAGIDLSAARVIGIKSGHNSGKTSWVTEWLESRYQQQHIPIYPITYRVSLERGYGAKFLIPTREEAAQWAASMDISGFTACIHSLKADSALGFDAELTPPGPVLLDEVRGVLWDLVDSPLVKRGAVVPQFARFLQRCSEAGYPIILMDAALTDAEISAIAAIIGAKGDEVVTLSNTHKPWDGRRVYSHDSAAALSLKLQAHLRQNAGPAFICTTSQKPGSSYGAMALERLCGEVMPGGRHLRVDAETVKDQNHPAAKLMVLLEGGDKELIAKALINKFLRLWDTITISPVIEAGVSLEIIDYFTGLFWFNLGNLPPENALQQPLRLRDKQCPVYMTAPERGMSAALRRGNGSHDPAIVSKGELLKAKGNLHQLLAPSHDGDRLDAALLDYWITAAARQNAAIPHYRALTHAYLREIGCQVETVEGDSDAATLESKIRRASAKGDLQQRAIAIGTAEKIDDTEAEKLKKRRYQSEAEQRSLDRHSMTRRYGADVCPGIALLDALRPEFRGQTQLLFYLTLGREHLKKRDQAALDAMAATGAVFLPDLNKKLTGIKIHALELLGIAALIPMAGELLPNDGELIADIAAKLEHCSTDINRMLGIEFGDKWGTVRRINHICKTYLGRPLLKRAKTTGKRGVKRRVLYRVIDINPPALDELPEWAIAGDIEIWDESASDEIAKLATTMAGWLLPQWLDDAVTKAAATEARVTHS